MTLNEGRGHGRAHRRTVPRGLGGPFRWIPLAAVAVLASLAGCEAVEQGKGAAVLREEPGVGGSAGAGIPTSAAPVPLLEFRHHPASRGLDPELVERALERAAGQGRLHNLLVARHGEILVERHFRGPPPHQPANVKSVSKTLLSAVVGYALAEGILENLDAPVADYFPEIIPARGGEAGDAPDPRHAITLTHLLTMSSGLESTSIRNYGRWVSSSDWVRAALTRPVHFEPGARMVYSTGNSHILSAVLTRASGRSTHALATSGLGDPAGIRLPPWPRDPQGIFFGGNDMLISPRDLVRFGEIYRQGGTLEGREILPREWVEDSWQVRIHSPRDGNGYGLGWWAREAGGHQVRFAWGYGGQFLFVIPALELTVVFTSDPWASREGSHLRVLHDLVDDFLVPAAERGGGALP